MNLALSCLLGCTCLAPAQTASEQEQMQGTWRVLMAFNNQYDKLEEVPYRGSVVAIVKNRLEWKSADGKTLFFAADFQTRPADKPNFSPEIDLVPVKEFNGDPPLTYPGRYVLFTRDVLKISFRVAEFVNLKDGRYPKLNSRANHMYFILERLRPDEPISPKASSAKDGERILGTWNVLASLDDWDDYARNTEVVIFTKDHLDWKGSVKDKGSMVSADYQLHPAKAPAWIDFLHTKGGNPPPPEDGFLPSIYKFLDDDTLIIAWPESGWKKDTAPQDRLRPARFFSDGDRNLWVLKRSK